MKMKMISLLLIVFEMVCILGMKTKYQSTFLKEDKGDVKGVLAKGKLELSKRPYKVNQCDQVILFKGSRIVNFDDYSKQKSSHFSLSAYLLNVFEDVKNTTNCSTGCGGCYEKVMNIISETIMGH